MTLRVCEIQAKVAAHYQLPVRLMTERDNRRYAARPRQVAMFLADKLTTKNKCQIARVFKRDHSTVIHAIRAIEGRCLIDNKFRNEVYNLAWEIVL